MHAYTNSNETSKTKNYNVQHITNYKLFCFDGFIQIRARMHIMRMSLQHASNIALNSFGADKPVISDNIISSALPTISDTGMSDCFCYFLKCSLYSLLPIFDDLQYDTFDAFNSVE